MPYITSVEEIGYDRGSEEMRETIARNLLLQRLPIAAIAEARGLPVSQLEEMKKLVEQT